MTGNTIDANAPPAISPGAATSCGITVTGNSFRGGYAPVISGICKSNSITVGNSENSGTAGMGKAGILVRAHRENGSDGNQTFTAGTDTVVSYNVEDLDTAQQFDTGTGTFLAPIGGVYRAQACVRFATTNFAAGDSADVILRVNGATVAASSRVVSGGTTGFTNCVADLVVLNMSDTLQTIANASGAATTRTIAGTVKTLNYFSLERLSD